MLAVSGCFLCFSTGSSPMLTARSPLPLAGAVLPPPGLKISKRQRITSA